MENKKKITTNISSQLAADFKAECAKSGQTMTEVMELFMKKYVEQPMEETVYTFSESKGMQREKLIRPIIKVDIRGDNN